jgi:hypothetical protein
VLLERLEADNYAMMHLEVFDVFLLQYLHLSPDADSLHLPKRCRPIIHLKLHAVDLDYWQEANWLKYDRTVPRLS